MDIGDKERLVVCLHLAGIHVCYERNDHKLPPVLQCELLKQEHSRKFFIELTNHTIYLWCRQCYAIRWK